MGERVVEGQRLMQAASDSFLGWVTGRLGREYYVRQLRDMKWSPDVSRFTPQALTSYAELCGHALARAHARTGDAIAIASYLGRSAAFDDAIMSFSLAYADQVSSDYAAFQEAVASGRLVSGDTTTDSDGFRELLRNPVAPSS
jgi:delta-aminolevulinic acid dehydratase/porphobilinogen synthase